LFLWKYGYLISVFTIKLLPKGSNTIIRMVEKEKEDEIKAEDDGVEEV
jgi:hypothetical protein